MKRFLSLILALCLCLTLLPAVALAADGVAYIDYVDGTPKNKTCASGTKLEATMSSLGNDDGSETWYYVAGDVTINGALLITGAVHLILCDNATLTVNGGIGPGANSSLTIYAQSTGASMGKLIAENPESGSSVAGMKVLYDLTINGGAIEASAPNAEYGYGIDIIQGSLIVNGGSITASGGKTTLGAGETTGSTYFGIVVWTGNATINGGSVTATGGAVNLTKSTSDTGAAGESFGLYANGGLTVSGGTLTATGGKVRVACDTVNNLFGNSYGLSLNSMTISGGSVLATGGEVSVSGHEGNYIYGYSYGLKTWGTLTASGGTVEASHGTATLTGSDNSEISMEDIYTHGLTVSGGSMQLKESYIGGTVTVSDGVTLADLLAEGYAYWVGDQPVKLSELPSVLKENRTVSIKPCEHSLVGGVCEYCGQGSADGLAWLLPVIGALDKEPFDDVKSGDWFYDDAHYVNENGLMTGTGSRTFSPDAPVTRGMVMTILARREGIKTDRYSPWYAAGVAWAVANGISDGSNPESEITREELATMLYRYAKLKGYDLSGTSLTGYADASSISTYAVSAMQWAVGSGLMNGSNGRLTPRDTATRAQLAAMLHRFFG